MNCEHKFDDKCICDICIDSYIDLYNKIEALQLVLYRWRANLTTKELDRINVLLKPNEKSKSKSKSKSKLKKKKD